jgi:hypothetical protein
MTSPRPLLSTLLLAALAAPALAQPDAEFTDVVQRTAGMANDARAHELADRHGLAVLNVTWEDTGRSVGSSVGPNISDMTIQVQERDPRTGEVRLTLMPVIRHPNFTDRSCDLPLDSIQVQVGNARGEGLRTISLRELLGNPRRYMTDPLSWRGKERSLLADRDSHVLVSAQACFLPVPRQGRAEFTPALFNYQSYEDHPAVLTILVTPQGTSMTIVDNSRDRAGWSGQRLYFNQAGQRAPLTGERLSALGADDLRDLRGQGGAPAVGASSAGGLDQVLLIQVPLRQPERQRQAYDEDCYQEKACEMVPCAPADASDVEAAVIGTGEVDGPFAEFDDLEIERDTRFPIRVTVQFYKATSNGVVSAADLAGIASQIESVYEGADFVGSLVTSHDAERPTMHTAGPLADAAFWEGFQARHQQRIDQSEVALLSDVFGADYRPADMDQARAALTQAVRIQRGEELRRDQRVLCCGTGLGEESTRSHYLFGGAACLLFLGLGFAVRRLVR